MNPQNNWGFIFYVVKPSNLVYNGGIKKFGDRNMISTRGRYAIRMMLDLAEHGNEEFVPLKDIAERQDISKKYLEQIIPILSRAGFLLTNRGFQGGYKLAKNADAYTVGDILRETENGLCPVSCLKDNPNQCPRADGCMTLPMWKGLQKAMNDYLDSITLQDLVDKNSISNGNYYI